MNKQKALVLFLAVLAMTALLHLAGPVGIHLSPAALTFFRWVAVATLCLYAVYRKSLTTWILVSMVTGAEFGHDYPDIAVHLRCLVRTTATETAAAHRILSGSGILVRLGIRDDEITDAMVSTKLDSLKWWALRDERAHIDTVYAPADQEGGNIHHNMVARAALEVFGDKVRAYTTYTRTELYTTGNIEIVPTPEELELKRRALECYPSQLRINRPHFEAVMGKSEWLVN